MSQISFAFIFSWGFNEAGLVSYFKTLPSLEAFCEITLKQAANEISSWTLRSLSSGSWKSKIAETRAGTKLSPGLGDWCSQPSPLIHPPGPLIPLLETVFRWKQETGGGMGVIYFLGITSPWRPGGPWCWKTFSLPAMVPWCWSGGAKNQN